MTKRTTYTYDVFDRRLAKSIDPDGDDIVLAFKGAENALQDAIREVRGAEQ